MTNLPGPNDSPFDGRHNFINCDGNGIQKTTSTSYLDHPLIVSVTRLFHHHSPATPKAFVSKLIRLLPKNSSAMLWQDFQAHNTPLIAG